MNKRFKKYGSRLTASVLVHLCSIIRQKQKAEKLAEEQAYQIADEERDRIARECQARVDRITAKKQEIENAERARETAYIEKEMMAGKKIVLVEPSAKSFYADIRKADEEGADLIVATVFNGAEFDGAENGFGVSGDSENVSLHFSVMNRVLKAAAYNIIEL